MSSKTALIPVDIQKGFDEHAYWGGPRNNPAFEANVEKLIAGARDVGVPIFHVQHNSTDAGSPLRPGTPGNDFMDVAKPEDGEVVFGKGVNSGFIGTALEETLRHHNITDVVIFGLTTDQCVSTTTRMAANFGFNVRIVTDACATFPKRLPSGEIFDAELIHNTNLASLHNEFAQVVTSDDVLASWS